MFGIFLHAMVTTLGGIFVSGAIAWLSWSLLGWTRYPGLGPAAAFVILALGLHSNDFTQMILLFSGLFAIGGLATLIGGGRAARSIQAPGRLPHEQKKIL